MVLAAIYSAYHAHAIILLLPLIHFAVQMCLSLVYPRMSESQTVQGTAETVVMQSPESISVPPELFPDLFLDLLLDLFLAYFPAVSRPTSY